MPTEPVFLYVEDDPSNRNLMQEILSALGFSHVHLFQNTAHFIARLDQLSPKPDLILLDIHIEPYNGFEVLNQIRTHDNYRSIPVVAVTASIGDNLDELKNAGFSGCITKPISWRVFPQLLDRILAGETIWNT